MICNKCLIDKDEKEFYKRTGRSAFYSECKKCFNIRIMERYKERANFFIEKKGGQCVKCGYNRCLSALEFHHLDPNKKDFELSKGWGRKIEKLEEEISKCILVCANCHREIHSDILIREL